MSHPPVPPETRESDPALASTSAGAPPRAGRGGDALFFAFACVVVVLSSVAGARARKPRVAAGERRAVEATPSQASAPDTRAPVQTDEDEEPTTLAAQRERLFARMQQELDVPQDRMERVRAVFASSPILGQGNPDISRHPMKRSECRRIREEADLHPARITACGGVGMVPLYDAEIGETPADARVCIDELEFPDVPCEYPVVQVRAVEAAALCDALGKRLCDAHEWEGACAGSLRPARREYRWGWPREEQSHTHNILRQKVWSYGAARDASLCATGSSVTPGCDGGGWATCGSNTYPTGAFPACASSLGVFDMHGNAAEHMSLPVAPDDLASRGGDGLTEMKGSWFASGAAPPHEDDCRWRAPAWHETRVSNPKSHMNYHLGFRCCKDV
jgi:hypothetical protein